MDCSPNALIALAQCNQCIGGELPEATIYLLCVWANQGNPPPPLPPEEGVMLGAPVENEVFGDPTTSDVFGEP